MTSINQNRKSNWRPLLDICQNERTDKVISHPVKKSAMCQGIKDGEERSSKTLLPQKYSSRITDSTKEPLCVRHEGPLGNPLSEVTPNVFFLSNIAESIYWTDIDLYLRKLEVKYSVRPNHISHLPINSNMRSILVDWLVDLQVDFGLQLDTLHLAISILDRYLQTKSIISKKNLQIVGMAAMLIAAKFEETAVPCVHDIITFSDNVGTAHDLRQMEIEILKKLDYELAKPTSLLFLRYLGIICKANSRKHTLGKYLLELSLLEYRLCAVRPSKLAASACFIYRWLFTDPPATPDCQNVWIDDLVRASGYSFMDIKEIVSLMASLIQDVPKAKKFNAIPQKYASTRVTHFSRHRLSRLILGHF